MSQIQKTVGILLNLTTTGNALQGVQDLAKVMQSLQPLAMQGTDALTQGLTQVQREAQRTAGGILGVSDEIKRMLSLGQRQEQDRSRMSGAPAQQIQALTQRHAEQFAGMQYGLAARGADRQLAHDAEVDRLIQEAQARTRKEQKRKSEEASRDADRRLEKNWDLQEQIDKARKARVAEQQAKAAWEASHPAYLMERGQGAAIVNQSPAKALEGVLGRGVAGGLGAGAGAAMAIWATATQAMDKAATAMNTLGNSTLTAAQKTDEMVKQFIPGGEALIRFRDALNGVADKMRRIDMDYAVKNLHQEREFVKRGFIQQREAEIAHYRTQAEAYGSITPVAPQHLDRSTARGEQLFQQEQRLLPFKDEAQRAQAMVEATAREVAIRRDELSKRDAELAAQGRREQAAHAKMLAVRQSEERGMTGKEWNQSQAALPWWRRDIRYNLIGPANDKMTAEALQAAGITPTRRKAERHESVSEALLQTNKGLGHVSEGKKEQERLDAAITEHLKAQSVARKSNLALMEAELQNLRQQRDLTAGTLQRVGAMNPGAVAFSVHAFNIAKARGGDLTGLPAHLQEAIGQLSPTTLAKWREQTARNNPILKEFVRANPDLPEFARGTDLAKMDKEIAQKHFETRVMINIDKEAFAASVVKALDSTFRSWIKRIEVETDKLDKKMQLGWQMSQNHH